MSYDTRLERCRLRIGLTPGEWAAAADIWPGQLLRYRSSQAEPRRSTLLRLVRAARDVTGTMVRASDLYDLGDDEPLGEPAGSLSKPRRRKPFPTNLDVVLRRYGFTAAALARNSRLHSRIIRRFQAGTEDPLVSTMAILVRTLRRMGADVRAHDVFDLGERDCGS